MKFLFRADASLQIGSGHVMRCLTLANALREQGHTAKFITHAHVGHLADLIEKQGFECILLPCPQPNPPSQAGEGKHGFSGSLKHAAWLGTTQERDFAECEPHILDFQPDWIICDHYALDATWQNLAQKICPTKIAVIDDLHDRPHQADVLIDQNWGHRAQDYADLLPPHCRVLAGTRYALLRPEFAFWRNKMPEISVKKAFSGSLQKVLLNLGGVDKDNITLKILQNLAENGKNTLDLTVVMGASAPHIASIHHFAQNAPFPCQVIVNANNMAELMAQSDWAIGAAGSTSWERCCLGLPTILLVLADNQRPIAQQLQSVGAALAFDVAEIGSAKWQKALATFSQPENLSQMAENAKKLCDGKGVARVINQIMNITHQTDHTQIRPAQHDDMKMIFDWRNHISIRQFMLQQDELIWENHQNWFTKQLSNPNFKMLIYTVNQMPQGYISFTQIPEKTDCWEWGFYTAPDCPRGHGTQMGHLALAWAFGELGACEIRGRVLPHNGASLRLHEKLGFFRQPENAEMVDFSLFSHQFLF
ncbi:UDP-2,4-diacetamido-2,4,6-trideoxy-beta-L-altropyranose hydrolase [Alysiella crassa]|nr:UDP-2,4-diacetamido-2,4,6-trideoxy-beta-L-altropyranose hydrolase [Alysiella crassa]UOP08073.1 UDP-2,4-diacetamido-2,4,6-trideoxy-beta-L-altropyranose hydrolase [Alysiella crassa]